MKVRKESRKLVTPSALTPKTKLKLSFLDHIQSPTYVGIIFYYKNSNGLDIHERLVKLEKSLSETLVLFYPFAGRYLQEGGFSFIDCGGQGVEYVLAKVDGDIDLLLDKEIDPVMLMNLSSFPKEFESANSFIVIQVNVFECGGLAIGVRFNHKLTDTCSLSMFMSAWSMACRDGTTHLTLPSFSLGSLIPQKEISKSDIRTTDNQTRSSPSDLISKQLVSKNFTFHYDVISRLKAEIIKDSNELNPESTSLQASRVEVISAVLSKAIIEIKSAKPGVNLKPFAICHTMNLRGKTNLRIPEYSCGNFFTRVVTPPWNVEETGIMTLPVLEIICDAIRKAKQQFSAATEVDLCSLVEVKHEESAEARRKNMDGEINLITFSSWSKFPFYKVNFGWGEPAFVSSTPIAFEIILLIDSKLNDGIEAWVTLDIDDMLLLEHKLDTILRVVQS